MVTSDCANCGARLSGEFCSACGQARFRPEHRSLTHLAGELFDSLTDFDSRIWRSLRALILHPGRIARDWNVGRRTYWISPIRLFLIVNLIYFAAPAMTDLSMPFWHQVRGEIYRDYAPDSCAQADTASRCNWLGQAHSRWFEPLLRKKLDREVALAKAQGRSFSLDTFAARYNARSDAIGKLMVILLVPFVALALSMVTWRSRRYFTEHFTVALGLVGFVLIFAQLILKPIIQIYQWAQDRFGFMLPEAANWMPWVVAFLILYHFAATCRHCYQSRWWLAVSQGFAAMAALTLTSIFIYRPIQFLLALISE